MSDEIEKVLVLTGAGFLLVAIVVFFTFAIKYLWGYLMPKLFPLAVEKGFIAASISWWSALGLAILTGILFYRSGGSSKD